MSGRLLHRIDTQIGKIEHYADSKFNDKVSAWKTHVNGTESNYRRAQGVAEAQRRGSVSHCCKS